MHTFPSLPFRKSKNMEKKDGMTFHYSNTPVVLQPWFPNDIGLPLAQGRRKNPEMAENELLGLPCRKRQHNGVSFAILPLRAQKAGCTPDNRCAPCKMSSGRRCRAAFSVQRFHGGEQNTYFLYPSIRSHILNNARKMRHNVFIMFHNTSTLLSQLV